MPITVPTRTPFGSCQRCDAGTDENSGVAQILGSQVSFRARRHFGRQESPLHGGDLRCAGSPRRRASPKGGTPIRRALTNPAFDSMNRFCGHEAGCCVSLAASTLVNNFRYSSLRIVWSGISRTNELGWINFEQTFQSNSSSQIRVCD